MSHPNPLRWRRRLLLAVAVGAVGVLGTQLLPTSATPGRPDPTEAVADTGFHAAGDGALPESAPRLRATHAPLSSAERGYAYHLARAAMPADARDVLGNPGGELLAADLPPLTERAGRRAAVAVYDHHSDRLHQVLVDLAEGKALTNRSVPGLQLPPTAAETAVALELALAADPAPAFVEEYREITGAPLLAPEQVHVVAGVWRPVDSSSPPEQATAACGPHRCLQLLVALPTGQYLGTHDFAVDLSARAVLSTAPQPHSHEPGEEPGHEH